MCRIALSFALWLGVAQIFVVGCGVDPDIDTPFVIDSDDGVAAPDSDADAVDLADATDLDAVDATDVRQEVDSGDADADVVELEFCDGHCDCGDDEYCSTAAGTCQLIIGNDVYYCCEDSGDSAACPQGQACHVPGTFGNTGTCGE